MGEGPVRGDICWFSKLLKRSTTSSPELDATQYTRVWQSALAGIKEMEQLNPHSVLVTGSNRGLGLEFIRQLVGKKTAPKWIFATCRDPAGPRAQVSHRVESATR
ncbi:hypothetical protein L345_15985, partial [Ophiophagus hannah]